MLFPFPASVLLLAALASTGCSFFPRDEASLPVSAAATEASETVPAVVTAEIADATEDPKPTAVKVVTGLGNPLKREERPPLASIEKLLPPEGDEILQQIQSLDQRVPAGFCEVKRPAEQFQMDMDAAIELSKRFLVEYPDSDPVSWVRSVLVRMEVARLPCYRDSLLALGMSAQEMAQKYREHVCGILAFTESNADGCLKGSICRSASLLASLCLQEQLEEYEELRSTAEILLAEYPEHEARPNVHVAVAQSFIREKRYEEAVKYLEKVIQLHSKDLECVLYNDRLFDALHGAGDLEGMEELLRHVHAEYPSRILQIEEGHHLRQQYEQWLCVSSFWIGHVRLALGDPKGAREAIQQHIAEGDMRAQKAEAEGRKPGQDICYTTLEFRSKDLLDFLDNYHGKIPKIDMDFGELWATEEKLTLRESKGKVVALVFRPPKNRTAEALLQWVQSLVTAQKGLLVGATIGYATKEADPVEDELLLQKMRDDLQRLRVSLPGGFDPDRKDQRFFREVHAVVGTPSIVLINKKGEVSWFLNDPRQTDLAIAQRVIERLLKE